MMKRKQRVWGACLVVLLGAMACSRLPGPSRVTPARQATATSAATATATPQLAATVQPVAAPAKPSAVATVTARFEVGPCPFNTDNPNVKCGYVIVPEDHTQPGGPTIQLAVAVLKNDSPSRLPDPVMVLAGGPGEKILAVAPSIAPLLADMIGERDLILFDQRGAGLSRPALECPEVVPAMFDQLDEPDPDAKAQAMYEAVVACHERLIGEGHNLSAYNTTQNAADVNAIRVALGYDQVNLYGGSYGSLLAQAVMRDHGDGVRSAVINSVLPAETSLYVESATTAAAGLERLLGACASDTACNTAYPNLRAVLFATIDQLDAVPVPVTLTNPLDGKSYPALLTGEAVFGNLVVLLYQTQLIPAIPAAIHDVSRGDYSLMTQLMSANLALYEATSRGMGFSVMCADDLIGRTLQDFLDARAALPRQLAGRASPQAQAAYGPFAWCDAWNVEQADPSVKELVASDIPAVIMEGEFDQVTPREYGQLVARGLRHSHFYQFPGIGHNLIVASACAREMARAFFDDPARAPDATCHAAMKGVVFDLPHTDTPLLVLKPFTDTERGFIGLVPEGWKELQPANMARGQSAIDPAYFVLEARPGTAASLFSDLAAQLGLDPRPEPVRQEQAGHFTWDFYRFDRRGNPVDLAVAEDSVKAYFVLLMSPPDEHDALYEQLFLPAVKAMAPLE